MTVNSVAKEIGFGDTDWHHYVLSVSGGGSDEHGNTRLRDF